jgi:hypothetical protein
MASILGAQDALGVGRATGAEAAVRAWLVGTAALTELS